MKTQIEELERRVLKRNRRIEHLERDENLYKYYYEAGKGFEYREIYRTMEHYVQQHALDIAGSGTYDGRQTAKQQLLQPFGVVHGQVSQLVLSTYSLTERLSSYRPDSEENLARLAAGLINAVCHLHKKGHCTTISIIQTWLCSTQIYPPFFVALAMHVWRMTHITFLK